MKAKEYQEAVNAYSRSIKLNPEEAATYCNRAMAYLRLKNFARCIEDADKTLEMEPEYVKAFHRRGKAYLAVSKFELAIRDFQFILEKNPDDKDINASLKQAREKLQEREEAAEAKKPKTEEIHSDSTQSSPQKEAAPAPKKGGFKKISIVEDSDSEEDEAESKKEAEETPKESEPVSESRAARP